MLPALSTPVEPSDPACSAAAPAQGASGSAATPCGTTPGSTAPGSDSDSRPRDAHAGCSGCSCLPASIFRERLHQLADEYERMQASFISQLGGEGRVARPSGLTGKLESSTLGFSTSPREGTDDVVSKPGDEGCGARPSGLFGKPATSALRQMSLPNGQGASGLALMEKPERQGSSLPSSPSMNALIEAARSRSKTLDAAAARVETRVLAKSERELARAVASPHQEARHRKHIACTLCRKIVNTQLFERFIMTVIVVNSACLGAIVEVEMSIVQGGGLDMLQQPLQAVEIVCSLVYFVELLLRIAAYGLDFFFDARERWWNIFDACIVVHIALDLWSLHEGLNVSALRVLRFMKIVKYLRVVRVLRSMKELRMILSAAMGSTRIMLWGWVLVIGLLYMFSLIFAQGMLDYIAYRGSTDDLDEDIFVYWGSVATAMKTLFAATSGGIEWDGVVRPLRYGGRHLIWIFFVYITFFMFVILNTITALFVEATFSAASRDFVSNIQDELEKKEDYVNNLLLLFHSIDSNEDGEVTLEEFMSLQGNEQLVAFFASLDITISDGEFFFRILSRDGTSKVKLEDFVEACIRLRGNARAVDLHHLFVKQTAQLQETRETKELLVATHRLVEKASVNSVIFGPQSSTGERSITRSTESNWRAKASSLPNALAATAAPSSCLESTSTDADRWNPELWSAAM